MSDDLRPSGWLIVAVVVLGLSDIAFIIWLSAL